MDRDLVAIGQAIAVAVGAHLAGAQPGHLVPVGEPVAIRVGIERVGVEGDLLAVREAIAVGVGQKEVGPEPDLDAMRMRFATMLDSVDTYSYVFDPYVPEVVESRLSDDLASIAIDLENGLRHFRAGDVDEALWWWQFSYVNNWGNLAGAALNALLTVVAHDRFDTDFEADAEQVAVANEILGEAGPQA